MSVGGGEKHRRKKTRFDSVRLGSQREPCVAHTGNRDDLIKGKFQKRENKPLGKILRTLMGFWNN